MSRILFTWELGQNLGHLARVVPIASALQTRGHSVLVAVREVPAAAAWLRSTNIPFVPAPLLPVGLPPSVQLNSYADLLLSQGWKDAEVLSALVQGWQMLFKLYRPDLVIHLHSPTAQLAAKLSNIPSVRYGNGFEIPPDAEPLPPFPGIAWANASQASASDQLALQQVNQVAAQHGANQFNSLAACLKGHADVIVSLSELDHYGPRDQAQYIMPCFPDVRISRVNWPAGNGRCIFVYIRPDTPHASVLLETLKRSGHRIVCVASGFSNHVLTTWQTATIQCVNTLVDLRNLLTDAALCISFGAEGTLTRFILAGVPQLIVPSHVENLMLANRVEATQAGLCLTEDTLCEETLHAKLAQLLENPLYRTGAQRLQQRYSMMTAEEIMDKTVRCIEAYVD